MKQANGDWYNWTTKMLVRLHLLQPFTEKQKAVKANEMWL